MEQTFPDNVIATWLVAAKNNTTRASIHIINSTSSRLVVHKLQLLKTMCSRSLPAYSFPASSSCLDAPSVASSS